ncbi:MAG: hypothetical protein DI604_23515 [Delftia acidovorans]|nr:MAG: hypothetical protein DI604_23515 [Delftia acidovorans]
MDREKFYAAVRTTLFDGRLSDEQVKGMEPLIDECVKHVEDVRQAAYILGGVYHETGRRMVPVREGFATSDAGARAAVAKLAKKRGAASAVAKYANVAGPYGQVYYGRGRIQITWLENYERLQKRFGRAFVRQPDLLLDSAVDAEVAVIGHLEGIWTGKKLSDYITGSKADYYGARRVVNGTDKAAEIAVYAKSFEAALRTAGYAVAPPVVAPEPKPATAEAPAAKSAWAVIFELLIKVLRGGK